MNSGQKVVLALAISSILLLSGFVGTKSYAAPKIALKTMPTSNLNSTSLSQNQTQNTNQVPIPPGQISNADNPGQLNKLERVQKKQNESFDPSQKPEKNRSTKLDSKLVKLLQTPNADAFAKRMGLDYHEGKVRLLVELDSLDPAILAKISEVATIETSKEKIIQIIIPVEKLTEFSSLLEIKKIKSPTPGIQNRDILVNGQIIEDSVFMQNVTPSKTISIAIIDLGFDSKNPKISANVEEAVSFRRVFGPIDPIRGAGSEYIHGTSMAEIITSVDKNAKLSLLAAANELEFLDAMNYAISKKVNMIVVSFTWVNYETNGQSLITKKVEEALASGITVVMPSGNYGQNHWEGQFADSDVDGWHEFAGNDEGVSFTIDSQRLAEKRPILVYLKWNTLPTAVSDFDLTLKDPSGRVIDYSSNIQKISTDELVEYINCIPEVNGTYTIGISNFGDGQQSILEVFSVNDPLEYPQPAGSVGVPADAKGAFVIGTLGTNGYVKSYSSLGPTKNGLAVPKIFTPDGMITESNEGKPFHGSSSSAAYAAGLMAFLLSTNQDLNKLSPDVSSSTSITSFGGKLSTTSKTLSTLSTSSTITSKDVSTSTTTPTETTSQTTTTVTQTPTTVTQTTTNTATQPTSTATTQDSTVASTNESPLLPKTTSEETNDTALIAKETPEDKKPLREKHIAKAEKQLEKLRQEEKEKKLAKEKQTAKEEKKNFLKQVREQALAKKIAKENTQSINKEKADSKSLSKAEKQNFLKQVREKALAKTNSKSK